MNDRTNALAKVDPQTTETTPAFVDRKGRQFAKLAPNFELRCWLYSLGLLRAVRRRTAEMALPKGPRPKLTALDLCCGTGGVTRELVALFPRVVGVDLSAEMLAVARRRCPTVQFVCGEAGSAALPEGGVNRFDACVLALGLHEMPVQLRHALLERATRCLLPGGRLVLSDYAWPRRRWVRALTATFAPTLIEPDILDFLDWPLDSVMADLGFQLAEETHFYRGILRISAWSRRAA